MEDSGHLQEQIAEQYVLSRRAAEIERDVVEHLRAPQFRSLKTAVEALPSVLRKIAEHFGSKYMVVYIGDRFLGEPEIELDRFAASNENDCHLPDEIVLNIEAFENHCQYSEDCGFATLKELLSPKPKLYEIYYLNERKVCLIVCGWMEDRPATETAHLALEGAVREISHTLLNANRLDEALEREARIKMLTERARHQLNASLQGIRASLGRLRSLLQRGASSWQLRRVAEEADAYAKEAGSIVDKLARTTQEGRVLGRTGKTIFKKASVTSICRRAAKPFKLAARERGISIKIGDSMQELPAIECDREEVGVLLFELIDNAVKFSHPNKPVEVFGSRTVLRDPATNANREAVEVTVRDFGLGIPKEDLTEKIFRPYSQSSVSDDKGTISGPSLGLYIASEIVNSHTGKICAKCKIPAGRARRMHGRPLQSILQGCWVEVTVTLPVEQIRR